MGVYVSFIYFNVDITNGLDLVRGVGEWAIFKRVS